MPAYELTKEAEKDLQELARYTLNKWGKKIFQQYRDGLKETFNAIAANDLPARNFLNTFPDLLVTKYRFHYIFYLSGKRAKPIVIGIIHERRDVVSRLSERLA